MAMIAPSASSAPPSEPDRPAGYGPARSSKDRRGPQAGQEIGSRMEATVARVVVLAGAVGAHGEARHGRRPTIVGNVADDGETRPAIRAVREGVLPAAIARVEHLAQAVGARRDVWRHRCRALARRPAGNDREVLLVTRGDPFVPHSLDHRERRRLGLQTCQESGDARVAVPRPRSTPRSGSFATKPASPSRSPRREQTGRNARRLGRCPRRGSTRLTAISASIAPRGHVSAPRALRTLPSADPRQRSRERQIEDAIAADRRPQHHAPRMLRRHPARCAARRVRADALASPRARRWPPGGTKATSLPSLATKSGSRPRISHAPRTASRTGMARSSTSMPTRWRDAISTSVAASPPRVGSRIAWMSRAAPSSSARPRARGAARCRSRARPRTRAPRAATGWPCRDRRSVPESSIASPGRTWRDDRSTPGGTMPMPEVLMKILSPLPRPTTLVSPVTIRTPARSAARRADSTTRRRSASGSPSSRMKASDSDERLRPADGEVVHRAVHRQLADVAAREEDRGHHEGVGGEGERDAVDRQDCLIVERARASGCGRPGTNRRSISCARQLAPAAVAEQDLLASA